MADDPDLALLNRPNLETWLATAAPQLGDGPLQAEKLQGGVSNAVFRISRGGETAMMTLGADWGSCAAAYRHLTAPRLWPRSAMRGPTLLRSQSSHAARS